MPSLVSTIAQKWRNRKMAKAEEMLSVLKARYHTFRALLANNEFSLDLLKSLDLFFVSNDYRAPVFAETVEELLDVTYELIDGLNRLTDNGNRVLYRKHEFLSEQIRRELRAVVSTPAADPPCLFFDEIPGNPGLQIGAKAASLAFLKMAGLAVPNGFVITPSGAADVIGANGIDTLIGRLFGRMLPGDRFAELEKDAAEIRERILRAALPEKLREQMRRCFEQLAGQDGAAVSVRSSALVEDRPEHSFAGQFKTVLNVTSLEAFELAYKEVLASNFSARATAYRIHAGLPAAGNDMAVICQRMVDARAAGVLFTIDPVLPVSGRMVISAVAGLGGPVVGGEAPTDIYRPLRENPEAEPMRDWAFPQGEKSGAVISREALLSLVRLGRRIEGLTGAPQDIEWAISGDGEIFILQSRQIRVSLRKKEIAESVKGKVLMRAGQCSSPGRCVGVVKVIRSIAELHDWHEKSNVPVILVLRQGLVDAAGRLAEAAGVIVDIGNPADHLSCVAREYARPMITGAMNATGLLHDGDRIILDADRTTIYEAPDAAWPDVDRPSPMPPPAARQRKPRIDHPVPEIVKLRALIQPLNLTDAYGPTFSIQECKSIHDLIRYTHEMAVLAMFEAGDDTLEGAGILVRRLNHDIPLHFMIIDMGGGIAARAKASLINLDDILCKPFLSLWEGVTTPGLRWSAPPASASLSGLFSRAMLDAGSARPVGGQNYALITGDYLNLNARVEFHFTMIDTICGPNPRENYIRFRFKGGGTSAVQRERRTRLIADILKACSFITDLRGDLLTASIAELETDETERKLLVIGRLLGFTRLLDSAMKDDETASKIARAFLDGDYGLETLGT